VRRIRLLQVGLGDWGRDWAWRVIPDVEDIDVVGYVDSNPAALDLLRKALPASKDLQFESLHEAIAATRPEAILITATLPSHAPIASTAIEAGLHVLVEKPFAPGVAVAEELVRAAAAANLVLMVSQNYRFFPAARIAKRLVEESVLGEPYEIAIDFRRYSASSPNGPVRHHQDAQPLLVDMSIHHFDLLRFILNREPHRIFCETWNPEWSVFAGPSVAAATVKIGDVVVSYRGSWLSAGPITPWAGEWRMEFERGEIFWTSRADDGALADRVVVRRRGRRAQSLRLPEMRVDRWATLTEFASSIREGREPECSGRENLGTLAFVEAAVDSARRHEQVEIRRVSIARHA
jgi:predicted dehydrogenase